MQEIAKNGGFLGLFLGARPVFGVKTGVGVLF